MNMLLPVNPAERPPTWGTRTAKVRAASAVAVPVPRDAAPVRAHRAPARAAEPEHGLLRFNADRLKDAYRDAYLRRQVEALQARQGCAGGASWGEEACLQPYRPYFLADTDLPVVANNALATLKRPPLAVAGPNNPSLDEGFHSARERRRFA